MLASTILRSKKINDVADYLLQNQKSLTLSTILFDLDNTLHNFHFAANKAMEVVYKEIKKHNQISLIDLKCHYKNLIKQVEKDAFTTLKSSHEYRLERFSKLLKITSIYKKELALKLRDVYGEKFEQNIVCENSMQEQIKLLSKKFDIHIVTEGPKDAQKRTLNILNIENNIQHLFTSEDFAKKKETGELFKHVINTIETPKKNVIVIGDSLLRDIQGATKCGIRTIHLTPFI